MSKLRLRMSMSLDGFVAGPDQSVKNPLGIGGMRLHEWVFGLKAWREQQGLVGGEVNDSSSIVEESIANVGWGENPPYHHPVFVLTHHARAPLTLEGGTTFTFVTDGIQSALDQARRAAGAKDVTLAGGAKAAQQYLNAGLVDEMEISLAPTLLGGGERLFDGVNDLHGLRLVRTVAAPDVTHLKFARR
jgi:dihydrofolate reductase